MIYDGGGGWVCACVWRGVFLQSTLVPQPNDDDIGNDHWTGQSFPISSEMITQSDYMILEMIAQSGGHFWYHFRLWYWKWPPDWGRVVVGGGLEWILWEDISQIWIKRPQDGVCDMQEPILQDEPCNLSQRPTVAMHFFSHLVTGVAFGIGCSCVEVNC